MISAISAQLGQLTTSAPPQTTSPQAVVTVIGALPDLSTMSEASVITVSTNPYWDTGTWGGVTWT